jgi:hypothetical protein
MNPSEIRITSYVQSLTDRILTNTFPYSVILCDVGYMFLGIAYALTTPLRILIVLCDLLRMPLNKRSSFWSC